MSELKPIEEPEKIKEYIIPVYFEMSGLISVKAGSAKKALDMVIRNKADLPLPDTRNYVENSYQIETDTGIIESYSLYPSRYHEHAKSVRIQTRAVLSDNKENVASVREALKKNEGYCPCQIQRTPDTRCICKEFREQTPVGETCRCGLYVKTETVE